MQPAKNAPTIRVSTPQPSGRATQVVELSTDASGAVIGRYPDSDPFPFWDLRERDAGNAAVLDAVATLCAAYEREALADQDRAA